MFIIGKFVDSLSYIRHILFNNIKQIYIIRRTIIKAII